MEQSRLQVVGQEYLNFSLDILRNLPSKRFNLKHLTSKDLENYRNTNEESSAVINGFQIVRGLIALAIVSGGNTQKEIIHLLNYACRRKQHSSKFTIEQCIEEINALTKAKNESVSKTQAIRMFFEQRDVASFDPNIVKMLDELFIERMEQEISPEEVPKHVMHEINFAADPSGITTKAKIDAEISKATRGIFKKVIRADLIPSWRARFLLTAVSNENVQLKTYSEPVYEMAYFYDSANMNDDTRTWVHAVKLMVKVRRNKNSGNDKLLITEIETINENETFLIIQSLTGQKLTYELLTNLTAEKIVSCLPVGEFSNPKTITFPIFRIPGSMGLRTIFDKKQPQFARFFGTYDPLAASRMFCPFKAEFYKIIGRQKNEASCMVFPLYEFYCKFRCNLVFEDPEKRPAEAKPVTPKAKSVQPHPNTPAPPPPPPAHIIKTQGQIVFFSNGQTNNNITFVGNFKLPEELLTKPIKVEPTKKKKHFSKHVFNKFSPKLQKVENVSHSNKQPKKPCPIPAEENSLHESATQKSDNNRNSLDTNRQNQLPQTPNIRVGAGNDASTKMKLSKNLFGMSPETQHKALDDSLYKPPAFTPIANYECQKTLDGESEQQQLRNSKFNPQLNHPIKHDDKYTMKGEEINFNHPFLFMTMTKMVLDGKTVLFPNFIGRFTNLEETFDKSWMNHGK